MSDIHRDPLWQAALAWWHSKLKNRVDEEARFTTIGHTRNPTIGCETPQEEALALAVAARLRIEWLHEGSDA